jgi:hypothetical protein
MNQRVRQAIAATVILAAQGLGAVAAAGPLVNHAPVANPGGPYVLALGQDLMLDASQSFDPDSPTDFLASYLWDLDGNGSFGDVSGKLITVPWAVVWTTMHPLDGKTVAIALKVFDSFGQGSAPGETTVRFGAAPPGGALPEPAPLALVLLVGAVGGCARLRAARRGAGVRSRAVR